MAEIWRLMALSFSCLIIVSCNKDDGSDEIISYKDSLDSSGWVVNFEKAEINMYCVERRGLDIDEHLATDMTGVVFQDNTIELRADYRDDCPNNYQSQSLAWASVAKEFDELNIEPDKTKQVVIKLTRESAFTNNKIIFQVGPNSYFYGDTNHIAVERATDEFEVIFDFEKNRQSIKNKRKINDELVESNVDLEEFTGSELYSIFVDKEYYFKPKITIVCGPLFGEGQVFYPNNTLIKNLEISVTSTE